MKTIFIVTISLAFPLFFTSCVKCKCEPRTDDPFEFKLINNIGNNLYSGATAIYKIDSLKIFYKNNSSALIQESTSLTKSTSADSTIFIYFAPDKRSTYYFYYTYNNFDSVNIEWKRVNGKCCGEPFTYDAIQSVKFKNVLSVPNAKGQYIFIR